MLRKLLRSNSKPIIRSNPQKSINNLQYDNYDTIISNPNQTSKPNTKTKTKYNRKELSLDSNFNNNSKPQAKSSGSITNAATNDNSQSIKYLSNRSVSLYTISQSSRNIPSHSQSNSNIFLQSESNKLPSCSLTNNPVNQMEIYIDHIKRKGFKNNEQLFLKQINKKVQLESSINKFNNHLAIQNKYNHKQYVFQGIQNHQKKKHIILIEINNNETGQYAKEIEILNKEIRTYEPQITLLNKETDWMNEIIIDEDRDMLRMKGDIQKINQMNSEIIKEKDRIKAEIMILRRVNNSIKLKIDDQLKKIAVFVNDVKTLANNDDLYTI